MGPRKGQPLHSGSSCKSLTQEGFLSLFAEAMQEGRGGKEFPRAPLLAQGVKKLFMFPGKFISSGLQYRGHPDIYWHFPHPKNTELRPGLTA